MQLGEEGHKDSRETRMEGLGTWCTALGENEIQWEAQICEKQEIGLLWEERAEFFVELMAWCNPGYAVTEGFEWEYPCYTGRYDGHLSLKFYSAYIKYFYLVPTCLWSLAT